MISRQSAIAIGKALAIMFSKWKDHYARVVVIDTDRLYDFAFEHGHGPRVCNALRECMTQRSVQEFVMRLHTGESVAKLKANLTPSARQRRGQKLLEELAAQILSRWDRGVERAAADMLRDLHLGQAQESPFRVLRRSLELDGYVYQKSVLRSPEEDVLDVVEEQGLLEGLFTSLGLGNKQLVFNHLSLCDDHYRDGRWGDCIGNARHYLEAILAAVASKHEQANPGVSLSQKELETPRLVRDYLANVGLLTKKEKEALAQVYGLLSETGGHPYMAESEQARLMRHLALTFCQFVMLRLEGKLKTNP